MAKQRHRASKYQREDAEHVRVAAAAAAAAQAARLAIHSDLIAEGKRERWAGVDSEQRVHVVKPFGPSPHHGLNESDIGRLLVIKCRTLGYLGCVVRDFDEDKVYTFVGHLGSVAARRDADQLVAALAAAYPSIPFRIEVADYIVSQVEWERVDAEPGDSLAPARM